MPNRQPNPPKSPQMPRSPQSVARPVNCTQCGTHNVIAEIPAGEVPVCRECGMYLPWVVDVTDVTFMDELKTTITVVIDFWATWCQPCLVMKPHVEQLALMFPGRVKVVMANADHCFGMQQTYGVSSFPTILIGRQGQMIDRIDAAIPPDQLVSRVAPYV